MATDSIKLGIRGHILVTSNKEGVLYDHSNTISSGALPTIIQCLSQIGGNKSLDSIKAIGDFGSAQVAISNTHYNPGESSIEFTALFDENSFNGTVTTLKLMSVSLGDIEFAKKTGLSLLKDSQTRLQIKWKITITIN